MAGTKQIKYREENIASENVRLSAEDLKRIEAIMPTGSVSEKVPERLQSVTIILELFGSTRPSKYLHRTLNTKIKNPRFGDFLF